MDIKQKHVYITGCNRGIGRATAVRLAESGAHLHLVNRTKDSTLAAECKEKGAESVTQYDLDLTSRQDIDAFLQKIKNNPVDIFFNNAGQLTGGLLEEQPMSEILDMLQVNVNALIQLTHGVLPQMLKAGHGKIINHSSVSGIMNTPCASTYSASKAAVLAFSNCLRNELKGTGVSVLCLITPGVETRMYKDIPNKYGKNLDLKFLKSMPPMEYAKMIREAILQDLNELRPASSSAAVGLFLAQHTPSIFNRVVGAKFKRV